MNEIADKKSCKNQVSGHQVGLLGELIDEVRRCCRDRQVIEAMEFGLPYAEIRCLMLFGNERYLTVKGMADSLEVARSRVTKLVHSMNEKDLIERSPDPSDGRVSLLRLTSKGRQMVERIKEFQAMMQAKILENLDPADRSRVISGLELLRSAMHQAKEEIEAAGASGRGRGIKQTDEVDHV